MTYVMPPYVCARLRETWSLALMKKEAACWQCCMSSWRQASLADQLLCLRFSKNELKVMSRSQKINALYQCDYESEFANSEPLRERKALWALAVPELQVTRVPTSPFMKLAVTYLKRLFLEAGYISVPEGFFQAWLRFSNEPPADPPAAPSLSDTLAITSEAAEDPDIPLDEFCPVKINPARVGAKGAIDLKLKEVRRALRLRPQQD